MLRTFIQISGLVVTLIASFFWIRGSLALSIKDIAALAGTYWNYNPATLQNLASQKADSLIAGLLLLVSFSLQSWNAMWPIRFSDFEINKKGVILSLSVSLVLFFICFAGASSLTKHYHSEAQTLLQQTK